MKLGYWNQAANHFNVLRELTTEEISRHEQYTPICAEARNRLMLFRLLDRNYGIWRSYLDELLDSRFKETNDISEELNRLILTYLTLAYTIQEHFEVSFKKRFRKDQRELDKHARFMEKLCSVCWPFAFILDFRGYVQHRGLAVGRCDRKVGDSSVIIEVVANAEQLLEGRCGRHDWERSKLDANRGEIDLIQVLKGFHIQMLQSYASFVVKVFFPELKPAAEFYSTLTEETKRADSKATMVFYKGTPAWKPAEGGAESITLNLVFPPNDLYRELGIRLDGQPPK